jgi:hypothetical protein
MSLREQIVEDLVSTLRDANNGNIRFVSRKILSESDFSRQQYPLVIVGASDESRNDLTMTGTSGTRESFLNVTLLGFVSGPKRDIDTLRNQLIEDVEVAIDADRTRNSLALNTELTTVAVENFDLVDEQKTVGRVDLTIEVHYVYTRGTP